jgi:3-isopropylmalate/(R)-2-methylmalate dehydratase large subunit
VGYAYEYAGPVIEAFSIEERLTVCNMSIEGGARCGYVNPDDDTIAYLRGREYAAEGRGIRPRGALVAIDGLDRDARYDDRVELDGKPARAVGHLGDQPGPERRGRRGAAARGRAARRRARLREEAYGYMMLRPGAPLAAPRSTCAHRLVHERAASAICARRRASRARAR